jgi:hypothetical protein
MAELTPEQRQQIYLEEKARIEFRRQFEPKKIGFGKIIGYVVLGGIGLLVVLWMIGSAMENSQDAAFKKLPPEQRHQETLQNCVSLLKSYEFQTYSELSVTDRRMKATCEEQMAHPDQDVFQK